MKPLTFTLKTEPAERLDLSHLTADKLEGIARTDIERIEIGTGRISMRVGDIFRVSGDDSLNILFPKGSDRFDNIGAAMSKGRVTVNGNVGVRVGLKMSCGTIVVSGNAQAQAGSAMTGGRLEIMGSAGESVGGPQAGELIGMAGGLIVIRGKVGAKLGEKMRRGVICALKGCGDYPGLQMVAGTICVKGTVGLMPGHLMKRGSLMLDRQPERISPTFVDCGTTDTPFISLFDRFLITEKIIEKPLFGTKLQKLGGDNAVLGKGEILYRKGR